MLEKFRKKDGREEGLCITEAIPIRNVVYDDLYGNYGAENMGMSGLYRYSFYMKTGQTAPIPDARYVFLIENKHHIW